MKYLQKSFMVGPAQVTQEEWDRIWGKRPKKRQRPVKRQPEKVPTRRPSAGR